MIELDSSLREARAREVRHNVVAQLTMGTHRSFRILFGMQWLVAAALAWHTALPGDSRLFITMLSGLTLGAPAALFTLAAPQNVLVRHWVALSQIGWSMLFAWLLEGHPEAQFHVFVSLAFLAFYRDWTLLVTAAAATVFYPVARIVMLPSSYVVSDVAWTRIFDQAIWVGAEVIMMMFAISESLKTVRKLSETGADLELTNEAVAKTVTERTDQLAASREQFQRIAETTRAIPFELDLDANRFTYIGSLSKSVLGISETQFKQTGFLDILVPREREPQMRQQLDECGPGSFEAMCSVITPQDLVAEMRWTIHCEQVGKRRVLRGFMVDVTEAGRLVRELSQGQKLESLGRIAAGVAHEINTSAQFVSDSVRFVRHSLKDVPRVLADYRALAAGVLSGQEMSAAAKKACDTDESADTNYFLENAPDALDRALDGIGRVGTIVRAMTEFAHPDTRVKGDIDLNRAIKITLNMARNEYKSVADLETQFGDLPKVRCHAGEINQVVLNLVLNAAHAIADAVAGSHSKGLITVRTRTIGDYVEISISDTGAGIPESVRGRIFEPFVTTKELGRGTGQGLALSRGIVVEKLKGSLHFQTETGVGTTFFIRLPVSDAATQAVTTNKQAAA